MNPKFQASVHHKEDTTFVKLVGVIDEDNDLGDLTDKIPPGMAACDLSEIERINSCGVRDWVNWLGDVEKKKVGAVFVKCSPAIVAQINLVHNFTGAGVVKSFYAPYFCPEHGEKLLLIEAGEMGPPPHKAPTCRCDECDTIMDFDDMEDSYFAFMSNPKKIANPEKIEKVVDEFTPGEEKSKIRSRVSTTSISGVSSLANSSVSSLPSVPSLPSISRTGMHTGSFASSFGTGVGGTGTGPGGVRGTNPGVALPPSMEPKTNKMVFVLVGVLLVAIVVLAALLFNTAGKKEAASQGPPISAPHTFAG